MFSKHAVAVARQETADERFFSPTIWSRRNYLRRAKDTMSKSANALLLEVAKRDTNLRKFAILELLLSATTSSLTVASASVPHDCLFADEAPIHRRCIRRNHFNVPFTAMHASMLWLTSR